MIDETDVYVAKMLTARMNHAFMLGLALGVIVGFCTTVLGMWFGWAVWRWWLA